MADFPIAGGGAFALGAGLDFSISSGTIVTGGSANTLGAYSTLVSAADNHYASNSFQFTVTVISTSAFGRIFVNLGIGPTNEEFLLIEDFFFSVNGGSGPTFTYELTLDIPIPAGVQIAAAVRGSVASQVVHVAIVRAPANYEHGTGLVRAVPFGSDQSTTRGTLLNPATVNVMSPWVVITTSLPFDIRAFFVCMLRNVDSWTSTRIIVEVGTGPTGEENTVYQTTKGISSSEIIQSNSPQQPVGISAGTQVQMRMQTNALGGSDSDLDAVFFGIQ